MVIIIRKIKYPRNRTPSLSESNISLRIGKFKYALNFKY